MRPCGARHLRARGRAQRPSQSNEGPRHRGRACTGSTLYCAKKRHPREVSPGWDIASSVLFDILFDILPLPCPSLKHTSATLMPEGGPQAIIFTSMQANNDAELQRPYHRQASILDPGPGPSGRTDCTENDHSLPGHCGPRERLILGDLSAPSDASERYRPAASPPTGP